MLFRVMMGGRLNLENPKSFSEKIQWLKIHDWNPQYTSMVDKVDAKEYVRKVCGDNSLIIKTYGVWEHFRDIDFDSLPDRFVLKANNSGGNKGVVICTDKASFDKRAAERILERALKRDLYVRYRERPYKDVPPRILAEEYIGKADVDFTEVKIMCFGGKVKYAFQCVGRDTEKGVSYNFYDPSWHLLPFTQVKKTIPDTPSPVPLHFERMKELAEILSRGLRLMRVDFYDTPTSLLFGEMTFYDGSGFQKFYPEEWDATLGSWLEL